jgi:hypothetical protein
LHLVVGEDPQEVVEDEDEAAAQNGTVGKTLLDRHPAPTIYTFFK